ncbi:hypothetical protein C0Q70_13361 [Pomacea canaliculata]|uniref:Cystatin domain-containing protein n=1 Tax=Pomacea canaliculata TaxID=400727 RepID=A0A2T7NX04_POMCA|nr:hypothetical protein C0Q70_13361 [Pomacea canaliculata]
MATSQLLVCAVAAVILAVVSGQLAGGISNVNLSMDAEPVTFAVDAINLKFSALAASTNDTYTPRQLVAIINAQQQVVSGMNYILTLLVAAGPQVTSSKTFFYFWDLQLEKYECSLLSRFLAIMSRDYNCFLGKPRYEATAMLP